MKIVTRKEWGAAPPENPPTKLDPKTLKGAVVHWFGIPAAKTKHADCAAQLRAVQRSHQAGEYNDVAYNHAVCQHGTVYELRGFGVQAGANGTKLANRDYAAIVAMIGTGDSPTVELHDGLRDLIGAWRVKGAGQAVRAHGSIVGTSCPGEALTAWVRQAKYEPLGWKPGDPVWQDLPGPQPKPAWFWKALTEMARRKAL